MIRIGIVGTGGMGAVHYHNYQHIQGCQVVGLVGITEQSRQCAEEWGVPLFPDVRALAKAEQVDLIDVCSPTFLHKEHVLAAFDCGAHAITEKPITLRKQDALEMYARADQAGKQLYVAQVLQFTGAVEVLRGLVQSGEYGKPLDGYFERLAAFPRWIQNGWLFDKEKSGLALFDLHVHDLDVIVSVFGRPETMTYTSAGRAGLPYPEHYRFLYGYQGMTVAAEASWFNADFPFTARWRVYFENAVVVNDGTTVTAYQFDRPPRVFDTPDEPKIPTGINLAPTGMFYHELSHFVDCAARNVPSDKVRRETVLAVIGLLEEMAR